RREVAPAAKPYPVAFGGPALELLKEGPGHARAPVLRIHAEVDDRGVSPGDAIEEIARQAPVGSDRAEDLLSLRGIQKRPARKLAEVAAILPTQRDDAREERRVRPDNGDGGRVQHGWSDCWVKEGDRKSTR